MSPEMAETLERMTESEARDWAAALLVDEFTRAARGELASIGWIESSDECRDLAALLGLDHDALVERLADRLTA